MHLNFRLLSSEIQQNAVLTLITILYLKFLFEKFLKSFQFSRQGALNEIYKKK